MGTLLVRLPDGRTRDYDLKPVNTIGRHPAQTIQVLDRLVSKEHIIIRQMPDAWYLEDLGSLNGTLLNKVRVTGKHKLNTKDEVTVGSTTMVFTDSSAPTTDHEVSIGDSLETSICNAVTQQTPDEFLPVDKIGDIDALRRDYEKLRVAAQLQHDITGEIRLDQLLPRLLDNLFGLFHADRGLILLAEDPGGRLIPKAVKVRGQKTAEPIALSRTILSKVLKERSAVLTSDAQHDERFSQAKSVIIQGIRSSMCVPLLARDKAVIGIIHLDSQLSISAFSDRDLAMLQGIAQQASIAIENSRLITQIELEAINRQKFEKMLSPNLVEQLLSGALEIEKGGELREVAVMFTDIRGFTSFSEKSRPEDLVKLLNEYFELMVDLVFEYEGTLDKYMGDGMMALWSAPVEVIDAGRKCVEAAVSIQKTMQGFNDVRAMDGLPPIHTGIGIDIGEVVAGYTGSSKTMSYTVLGSPVNIASRLCSKAAPGEILITPQLYEICGDALVAEEGEPLVLKGVSQPIAAWKVTDMVESDEF
jgi:adenylate cyclase